VNLIVSYFFNRFFITGGISNWTVNNAMLRGLIRRIYADHDSPEGSLEQNTWMGSEPERISTALPYITRNNYYHLSKALLLFQASGIALGGLGNECLALLSSSE